MKKLLFLLLVNLCSCSFEPINLSSSVDYADELINFNGEQKVHIEIEPQGELPQIFYYVSARDLTAGLALRPKVKLEGRALGADKYYERDNSYNKHDIGDRFTDIIALPRANNSHSLSPQISSVSSSIKPDQSFQLELLAGLSYTLVINPTGLHDRAPIFINWSHEPEKRQILLDVDEVGEFITGQIRYQGAPKDMWQAKILHNNRLVSCVAAIKRNGYFALELAKNLFLDDNASLTLILEPKDPDSPLPRFKKIFSAHKLLQQKDLGKIDLGRLDRPISAQISLPGPGFFYLTSTDSFREIQLRKAINLVGPTIFEELYPGIYNITIIPPSNSPWGIHEYKNIEISDPNLTIFLQWPTRQMLNAQVVNKNSDIITGAQIEFINNTKSTHQLSLFTAITNNDGLVCQREFGVSTANLKECAGLLLDEGNYIAHVIPPAGSQYAHEWQSFDVPRTSKLELKLGDTQTLTGKILGSDHKSVVRQAYITIYAGSQNTQSPAKVLASAITDAQGNFKAFIPATNNSY
jgi:hypothetical protein